MGEQLEPEGEERTPGMRSPACFSLDGTDLLRRGPWPPGPPPASLPGRKGGTRDSQARLTK